MWGYIANNSSMLQNVSCYCTPYINIFFNSLSSAKLIITLSFLSFVISQNTKNNICTNYPPARVMKQVVLFFEIKFTTVVKTTFRKKEQMRQANVNGRKIYKYQYFNAVDKFTSKHKKPMYMYMYLRISVPTVQMLLKTNAPVHVKPERQITLISYN